LDLFVVLLSLNFLLIFKSLNFSLDYDKLFFSLICLIGILMKNKRINLFFKIDKREAIPWRWKHDRQI